MQSVIVATVNSDGIINSAIVISAHETSIIQNGKYAGRNLGEVSEIEFVRACCLINDKLPKTVEKWYEDEELSFYFYDRYYEYCGLTVQIHWTNTTMG